MVAAQEKDSQRVAGAQRIDVVAHVADKHELCERNQRDELHGAEQKLPAQGDDDHRGKINEHGDQQPEQADLSEAAPEFIRLQTAKCQHQEDSADYRACCQGETFPWMFHSRPFAEFNTWSKATNVAEFGLRQ